MASFYSLSAPIWLKNGQLSDDTWTIETENPEVRRHASIELKFNIPIAPNRNLADAAEWRDLLTAKQYVYFAMSGQDAWIYTASAMNEGYRGLLAFIRWRNQRGLPAMKDLTVAWFEEFCASLKRDGLEGLMKSELTVASLIRSWSMKGVSPPHQPTNPSVFSLFAAAQAAGFDDHHLLSSGAVDLLSSYATTSGLRLPRSMRKRVERSPIKREYRSASLDRYLRVWVRLGQLRERMAHDPIGYAPFGARSEASQMARRLGSPPGRTRTAPAFQVCYLVDRALRWVLLYADDIKAVWDHLVDASASLDRPLTPVRRARLIREAWQSVDLKHFPAPSLSMVPGPTGLVQSGGLAGYSHFQNIWLRLLPGACAIVVAAFSARRCEEIASLRDDCIESVNGEPWLRTYAAKTLRGRERIPAATAVVKAVEVLGWLSATARVPGSCWLLQVNDPVGISPRTYAPDISRALRAFSTFVDVPPLPDGSEWIFAPHQFRRFFAIIYYYRYRDRSLTALSNYLQHYDPDSTRSYLTEARVGGFLKMVDLANAESERSRRAFHREKTRKESFEEVALEFRVEVYNGILNGKEHIGGFGGERVRRDLQGAISHWNSRIEVGDFGSVATTLDEVILAFAKERSLEPNGAGHSYCSCTTSPAEMEVAACLNEAKRVGAEATGQRGPDPRFAYDVICSSCPHNVQLSENRIYWEGLLQSARASCAACPGTLLAQQMVARARAAEDHLERCFSDVGQ